MADNISKYNSSLSKEERRKNAQKAGECSGRVRRNVKTLKRALNQPYFKQLLLRAMDNEEESHAIIEALINDAKKGDLKAFKIIRDLVDGVPGKETQVDSDIVITVEECHY